MKARFVDVVYTRTFPHEIGRVYGWLTDYRDDDPAHAGAVLQKRTVLKREGNVVHLEGENVNLGRRAKGQAEVHLFPERSYYEARIVAGSGRGSLYTYQLAPTSDGRTRLEVHYKTRVRRVGSWLTLTLAKGAVRRELATMWDGFAAAMAKDLGS